MAEHYHIQNKNDCSLIYYLPHRLNPIIPLAPVRSEHIYLQFKLIKATLVSTPPGTTLKLVVDKLGSHNITWSTRRCERLGALRFILAKNIIILELYH